MTSDRETSCKTTSEDLKNDHKIQEDQKLSKLCSEAGSNLVEVGQFFYALPSPKEPKIRSLCRETHYPEMKRQIVQKGGSKAMHDSALSRKYKFAKHGRDSVEVKVPSLFEDQTTSWIRIVNGVENIVREAMPIQEGEEASGRPAAKAKPILKPASTSDPNFIPMKDWRWIDWSAQIKGPILLPGVEVPQEFASTWRRSWSGKRCWSSLR